MMPRAPCGSVRAGDATLAPMDALVPGLTAVLRERPELRLALLFGSRGRGTAREDSDVDLALLGPGPLSVGWKIDLMRALGKEFALPIDLIDLWPVPEPVTGEALQGIRLVGSDETFAELLIRHLDNVDFFVPLQRRMLDERRDRWLR